MEFVAPLSQVRTVAAQCGLFTHKSVPVIFEPPCASNIHGITKIYNFSHFSNFSNTVISSVVYVRLMSA